MNKNSGFTLIELAMVILISGLLFLPLIKAYDTYVIKKKVEDSRDAVSLSASLVTQYRANEGGYPCPADAGLPSTDANYGVSQCTSVHLVSVGDCTPSGGLCLISGDRDADGDSVMDPVLVGGIPFATLKTDLDGIALVSNQAFTDAWGNRIMYAVTASLTSLSTYNYYNGVISAVDEYGFPTAGVDQDAHFAVFSPGRDNRGGFSREGALLSVCSNDANSEDYINCDGDAVFIQAKGYYLALGADYYDDDILFGKEVNQDIWIYEQDKSNVRTAVTGNVGIGTNNPTTKLDVQDSSGNALISTDNSILVKEICKKSDPTKCFEIETITGSGTIRCGDAKEVMTGISEGEDLCEEPTYLPPFPDQNCPAGQWITGYKSNGAIICS